MRVGLSCATMLSGRARDGIGVYTAALADALPGAGVEVQGFVLGTPATADVQVVGTPRRYMEYVARDVVGMTRPLSLPVDVVHFTDYHIVPSSMPSVATLHDAVPLMHPEWVSPRLRWAKNHVMKRMARHADQIVAVSHFAIDELVEYFGIARDRIQVVHGGIDEQWLIAAPPGPDHVTLADGRAIKDYFLCVGTFQPRKNLDRMISAYLSLPRGVRQSHPLVIVGRAGWRCEHTVQRLNDLAARGETVHWMQNIHSRQQLRAVYDNATALAFVSLYEGFGLPVLEAFACGTPVITSTASSLPEVAGGAALLVSPHDQEEIADAMLRIATSGEIRDTLREAGHRRVPEFTWGQSAIKMAAVYANLL